MLNYVLQMILKLKEDLGSKENIKKETIAHVGILKSELNQSKLNFETKIKTIQHEKEREINCVYVRSIDIGFKFNAIIRAYA